MEETLPTLLEEERVDVLFFLGDITEIKDGHEAELVNRVVSAFHKLAGICPVVWLLGNHDWFSSPDNPYFAFLTRLRGSGISCIAKPTPLAGVKNVPEAFSRACKAVLLPHTPDFERDWQEINFRAYDWAFAHQSFSGAKTESGFELGGVPLSYFPKGLRIISGDVHKPQTWGPLTYVGAPYCVDFGDEIEPRVLLWEDNKLFTIAVPGPQKRLVELGADLRIPKNAKLRPDDIVKVRVEIDSLEAWPEALQKIQRWAASAGVTLYQAVPVLTKNAKGSLTKSLATAQLSDEEILRNYGKKHQLADTYVSTGLKLL